MPAIQGYDLKESLLQIHESASLCFVVSTSNIAVSIPVYAKFDFLLTFLFFNCFAINMGCNIRRPESGRYIHRVRSHTSSKALYRSQRLAGLLCLERLGFKARIFTQDLPAYFFSHNLDLPLILLDSEKLRHDCALASCARSRQTAKMPTCE